MNTLNPILPEWHTQSAVLLTWPHAHTDFKNNLPALDKLYTRLTQAVTRESQAKILCSDEVHQVHIENLLATSAVDKNKYALHLVKTNDIWIRDYGVLTVEKQPRPSVTAIQKNEDTADNRTLSDGVIFHGKGKIALKFTFNAWGGKYDATLDNAAMYYLWDQKGLPHGTFKTIPFVLEGGSIEVDGHQGLLTTSKCLLAPTRNPGLSQAQIEAKLYEHLGVNRFLWLHHGGLEGDDTDSHIDMLARFCDPTTICHIRCDDKDDPHFECLQKMEKELKTFRDYRGQPYDLVPLTFPKPKHSKTGKRLPASYVNFLINNAQVIVPTYQNKVDDLALKQLEMCFSDKQITPVDATALIEQYGGIHCATMQV